jgi:hypothetical protein
MGALMNRPTAVQRGPTLLEMFVSNDDVEMLDAKTDDWELCVEIVDESRDCYFGGFVAYRGLADFEDDGDDDPYCELGEGD